jgi:hypothetical protein
MMGTKDSSTSFPTASELQLLPSYAPIHDVFVDVKDRLDKVIESQSLQIRKMALLVGMQNGG